jgi:hypothetical protein
MSRNHVSRRRRVTEGGKVEEGEEVEEEDLHPRRSPRFDHDSLLHYPG